MNSNRSISIDFLKSVSIIGVIFIHGANLFVASNDIINEFILFFRFSVPCFLIIWTYFIEKYLLKRSRKERLKLLKTKFLYLFRVFIIWSLIYFVIIVDINNLNKKDIVFKYFTGYGWSGQYYFIILFQGILFYPLIRYIFNNKILRYFLVFLVSLSFFLWEFYSDAIPDIILKLSIRPIFYWLIYIFIGIYLARGNIKMKLPNFLIVPALLIIPLESFLTIKGTNYMSIGVLISSIIISFLFIQNKWNYLIEKTSKIWIYVGKNTLVLFVTNPIIIMGLNEYFKKVYNPSFLEIFCLPIISTLIILLLGLGIEFLFRKLNIKKIFF